jgi:Fis family transcriptional regulator
MSKQSIEECVRRSLEKYFRDLEGEAAHNVYEMVMLTVERPVLEVAMEQASGNQSIAAGILGINRNTLRKKLQVHGLL